MPHLVHLYSGVFGKKAMPKNPTNGGIVEKIMKYNRKPFLLLVIRPIAMK